MRVQQVLKLVKNMIFFPGIPKAERLERRASLERSFKILDSTLLFLNSNGRRFGQIAIIPTLPFRTERVAIAWPLLKSECVENVEVPPPEWTLTADGLIGKAARISGELATLRFVKKPVPLSPETLRGVYDATGNMSEALIKEQAIQHLRNASGHMEYDQGK